MPAPLPQVFISKDLAQHFGYRSAPEALRGLRGRVQPGYGGVLDGVQVTEGPHPQPTPAARPPPQGHADLRLGREGGRCHGARRGAGALGRLPPRDPRGHTGGRGHFQRCCHLCALRRWAQSQPWHGPGTAWHGLAGLTRCPFPREEPAGRPHLWLPHRRQEMWDPGLRRHCLSWVPRARRSSPIPGMCCSQHPHTPLQIKPRTAPLLPPAPPGPCPVPLSGQERCHSDLGAALTMSQAVTGGSTCISP